MLSSHLPRRQQFCPLGPNWKWQNRSYGTGYLPTCDEFQGLPVQGSLPGAHQVSMLREVP
ncbi:hypothetical protein I7I53_06296 [Histoplasma capsulatum var. duboisii H88]|uniref:Uncharacterized protein n=1 Tax=Ajellomyces capsulatus (strain H88) TaxID=544711 RepID=A0A8A1LBI9_AJEC8|nr:hypothetical protein I7I53_06296 [Histoplasma capsulatum var. duboisii H88]